VAPLLAKTLNENTNKAKRQWQNAYRFLSYR